MKTSRKYRIFGISFACIVCSQPFIYLYSTFNNVNWRQCRSPLHTLSHSHMSERARERSIDGALPQCIGLRKPFTSSECPRINFWPRAIRQSSLSLSLSPVCMGNAKLDRREHYIVADSSDKMHHTEGYYPNALLQYRCNPAHTTTCRVRWILVLRPSALSFTYTTKPTNQKEMHFSTYGDTIACLHTIYSYEWMVAFLRTH